ncbi:MAG: cation diffusion facilitator family transporter [Clostridia bacterium]|nr:cation diffusion facilitator family transporter [Clostridia bacterium]
MKSEKNILVAFLLNLSFSIIEFFGGIFTNSVAIISDSIHDLGDSISIGISYFLERKSKRKPDENYTYGYVRYSVLGSTITTAILFVGSLLVIYDSVLRILNPVEVNYEGMIIFAILGLAINSGAALFTRNGISLNQKAVSLHMLEDVLGWFVVLIGAIIMKFTNISIIDPIMSISVSTFILINTVKNFKEVIDIFLEKTPSNVDIGVIKEHLLNIEGVKEVYHIHVWSMDGYKNFATMHIVTDADEDRKKVKKLIREELGDLKIGHVTIEIEEKYECCGEENCKVEENLDDDKGQHLK